MGSNQSAMTKTINFPSTKEYEAGEYYYAKSSHTYYTYPRDEVQELKQTLEAYRFPYKFDQCEVSVEEEENEVVVEEEEETDFSSNKSRDVEYTAETYYQLYGIEMSAC